MDVLEIFKELCSIPHCSKDSDKLKNYLVEYAKKYGYCVAVDNANNILCTKTDSKITMQSHYDMVCIGEYENLELYEEEMDAKKWLRAKNSTLGADNGIGIALTLKCMAENREVDALFTADEEIGLIGARALDLEVKTPYLLNIDSEDEGVVTLGCAGGVDVKVVVPIQREVKRGGFKEVEKSGYKGGHSGVDIHLNIENAIIELATVVESDMISIDGGERRNSIAKKATAILHVNDGDEEVEVIQNSDVLIKTIKEFQHGVREFNDTLEIVESSVNLAMIKTEPLYIEIHLSLRSMDDEKLQSLLIETTQYFESRLSNAVVSSEGYYAPWKPVENSFTKLVFEANEKIFDTVKLGAIHAGLECGILGEKMPHLEMASIGPNIIFPHSTREAVEIASVLKVEKVVETILRDI